MSSIFKLLNAVGEEQINCLTLTAEQAGSTVILNITGSPNVDGIQYKLKSGGWTSYTIGETITLSNVGDKVYFQDLNPGNYSKDNYRKFVMTGKIAASGNIQSMLNYSEECIDYCYQYMFYGCSSLTKGPELPAITLANYCYQYMFFECSSLISAPELPATILANYCYNCMFNGCTGLTSAPELPATTLAERCYQTMFMGCTSLIEAPELPATTLATYCYATMFLNCTSLTEAPELPATSLAPFCYTGMFSNCTSLTEAPKLPATTLANQCYMQMFQACTSLTKAPELPATTLVYNCYSNMFKGCTGLTSAPELPATTLAERCYRGMFMGCTSLIEAPELPATTLVPWCYTNMFNGCTSLTEAPELPATTLAERCYLSMFNNCTSLTKAPELPATTLADYCYQTMFNGCTSLIEAPTSLPAIILAASCYKSMFLGCTSLTNAPELPATTLANNCYQTMFKNCTSLTYIKVGFKTWDTSYTENWVDGITTEGLFECPQELTYAVGTSYIPQTWQIMRYALNPLKVTALSAGTTVQCNNVYLAFYRKNTDVGWNRLSSSTKVTLDNVNDYVQFLDETPSGRYSGSRIRGFIINGNVDVTGDIMSMNNYRETLQDYCFASLFLDCTSIQTAKIEMPNVALSKYCCDKMFSGCTSLTEGPELPATTLNDYCYQQMFNGCTNLTKAPELPATTLAPNCYAGMFLKCSSLTKAPKLPAMTLANYCYSNMFSNCTSLTEAPELPATTLVPYCYVTMFLNCTSLTKAPELPATTLTTYCYRYLFRGCSNLNYIKVGFTDWGDSTTTQFWVYGVSSSGTFQCPDELSLTYGANNIPENWTVSHQDPEEEIAYTYDIVVSNCGVQKLNGIYKLVDTSTTGTSRVFQHTKSTAKLQFTGAIDGWWLYSEYPNEDGDDYDFYSFNSEPTGGPWYAVNSVTIGSVPTLTYGTVEPPADSGAELTVAGVSNLSYAAAIDPYKYADGTYTLQSGTDNSRVWKKTDSGYTMYVRYSEYAESWVIASTLDDDALQQMPHLSKTTYTADPWDGTTWNVSLDATTCELTLTI